MSNAASELNDDFNDEETQIMVTPSPKPKNRITSEFMVKLYVHCSLYTDALTIYILMIVFKQIHLELI